MASSSLLLFEWELYLSKTNNGLYFQQLSIAGYQVSFYANNFCE